MGLKTGAVGLCCIPDKTQIDVVKIPQVAGHQTVLCSVCSDPQVIGVNCGANALI
jgi:hypothetical protein